MKSEVKRIVLWRCLLCERDWATKRAAESCAARGFHPTLKVGDIVIVKCLWNYCWQNGDEAWIAPGRDFPGDRITFGFYYVVTCVDRDEDEPHRPRYHLVTDAMTNGGHRRGWTYDENHYTPKRVSPSKIPAKVKRRAVEIVKSGERAKRLL